MRWILVLAMLLLVAQSRPQHMRGARHGHDENEEHHGHHEDGEDGEHGDHEEHHGGHPPPPPHGEDGEVPPPPPAGHPSIEMTANAMCQACLNVIDAIPNFDTSLPISNICNGWEMSLKIPCYHLVKVFESEIKMIADNTYEGVEPCVEWHMMNNEAAPKICGGESETDVDGTVDGTVVDPVEVDLVQGDAFTADNIGFISKAFQFMSSMLYSRLGVDTNLVVIKNDNGEVVMQALIITPGSQQPPENPPAYFGHGHDHEHSMWGHGCRMHHFPRWAHAIAAVLIGLSLLCCVGVCIRRCRRNRVKKDALPAYAELDSVTLLEKDGKVPLDASDVAIELPAVDSPVSQV